MSERDQLTGTADPGLVHVRWHEHVAELVLDRPEAMNAISTQLARELADALHRVKREPSVRAVVMTSTSDRAFCVGADLKERNSSSDQELMAQRPFARAAYAAVGDLPVPTIAAVHGWALGGGFELALACDLIVADHSAVFGLPEVTVGVVPGGGGSQNLVRRVGYARASDLILTGRRVTASEAVDLGLVARVVDNGRTREHALELARTLAGNSPVAVRNAKRALRIGQDISLDAALEVEDAAWRETALSADRAEGVAAFVERRPPDWKGH